MRFLSDPSLPGHGVVSGVFLSQDASIVAVASSFQWLTNPPARASYSGQRLRHRVALYRSPETKPIAVFDKLRLPVNDVAFHPSEPTVAIASGSYDGGYLFEGELVVWDWKAGRYSNKIGPIPEVVRTAFCNDGACIVSLVRPWNEDLEDDPRGSFKTYYEVRATYSEELFEGIFNEDSIELQMSRQKPLPIADVASDPRFPPLERDIEPALRRAFNFTGFRSRSPIWDIAWCSEDEIAIVHDDCQLEILDSDGVSKHSFRGRGHGSQIFKRSSLLVHAIQLNEDAQNWDDAYSSQLLNYNNSELKEVARFSGSFTFSVSDEGWVLGRCSRSANPTPRKRDVIGNPGLDAWTRHDIGHYDVFNHFIRIDGAPYLFAVQGTPPSSHEHKQVCLVSQDGSVEPLWPVLQYSGSNSGHAMECAFGYVADSVGEGIVVSGRDYYQSKLGQPYSGFIFRKRLQDGKELWRHETKAGATAIKIIPGYGIVLAAFLNGDVAAIESSSGDVLEWTTFRPGGISSAIFSFDVSPKSIVVGTIDGRVGTLSVSDFLESGFN